MSLLKELNDCSLLGIYKHLAPTELRRRAVSILFQPTYSFARLIMRLRQFQSTSRSENRNAHYA